MMRAMSKVEEMELMAIVTAMDMMTPAATMIYYETKQQEKDYEGYFSGNQSIKRNKKIMRIIGMNKHIRL